jgi:hypothetical protein
VRYAASARIHTEISPLTLDATLLAVGHVHLSFAAPSTEVCSIVIFRLAPVRPCNSLLEISFPCKHHETHANRADLNIGQNGLTLPILELVPFHSKLYVL